MLRITFLLLALTPLAGLAAEARLQVLEPQGAQRGTEVQVTLRGPRIGQEPQQILCERPGLEVLELKAENNDTVLAKFKLAPDAALGPIPLRIRTTTGLSNVFPFMVGNLPEQKEAEPNNDLEHAQAVPLGATVNGLVQYEDVDYFVIEAAEGDRISVELEGLRLARTFFDAAVAVLDEKKFELAACDDTPATRQDPSLSVIAPKAGKYYVQLREAAYQGNDACTYRLHIGKFPRPLAAFPPGGKPGETLQVKWLGPGAPAETQAVTLPTAATESFIATPTDANGAAPTGLPLRVNDLTVVTEAEPNNSLDQGNSCEASGACHGVIGEPGDYDHYKFTAKQGQVIDIRVFARRLRSPLDPILRVFNAKNEWVAGNDDDAGQPDSYIRFTAPADGEYRLQLEDQLKAGGEAYVYRIEMTAPFAAADLRVEDRRYYEPTTIEVPQGGKTAAMFTIGRRDVGGDMQLDLPELPAGVTVEVPPLAGDFYRVPVIFSATPDAALTSAYVPVTAKLIGEGPAVATNFMQPTLWVRGANERNVWSNYAERLPVAVTPARPFTLELVPPKSPLARTGSKDLKVIAHRAEGFTNRIAVYTLYDPPGVSSNRSLGIEAETSEANVPVTANGDAWTRDWPICVVGEVNVDGVYFTSTQFAPLKVVEPYFNLTFPSVAAVQGNSVEYVVAIEQRTRFTGAAKVELQGLPPGATATAAEFTAESKEVKFQITLTADARVGRHKSLFCHITHDEAGEAVTHNLGTGELCIDPVPQPAAAQTASK